MIKTKIRNFKTSSNPEYIAAPNEIKEIKTTTRDIPLPAPFLEYRPNRWALPYTYITDIIKNGRKLYYIVFSNCHYDHGNHEYRKVSYSAIYYGNSKKEVKEFVMKGFRAAKGFGDGRCINCILEINKMHPYEITKMLNAGHFLNEDKLDTDKWYASFRKDYPGVMNPACIKEMCREYEEKYGESVDAWKSRIA